MSCTDPKAQTSHTTRGSEQAERQAADESQQAADAAELEIQLLARSIAHDAYYAKHEPEPGVILVPTNDRALSPDASLLAHGLVYARVKTHLYRATHAWVCLDCRWVGAFTDEGVDQTAQRDAHICPEEGRR